MAGRDDAFVTASSPRISFQGAKPLSGNHRMAALLISSFFPTNGVADCYSGNHQGKKHHELREHLKVTHDRLCRFRLLTPNAADASIFMLSLLYNSTCPAINWSRSGLSYMRMCLLGRRKAKRHLLPFKPWSLFTGSVIIISCQTIPVKPSEQLFNIFGSGADGAAIRFYWDAWRSFTSAVTFLLGRFMFVYARCLPQRAKQDGLCFYSAWVGIAIRAFS